MTTSLVGIAKEKFHTDREREAFALGMMLIGLILAHDRGDEFAHEAASTSNGILDALGWDPAAMNVAAFNWLTYFGGSSSDRPN